MNHFDDIELHTERCTLRPWQKADAPSLSTIANTKDISWNTSFNFPYPMDEAAAEKLIDFNRKGNGDYSWQFAAVRDEKLIGGCGATRGADVQSHTAIVGYWLDVEHWGQGLATELLGELITFMRDETDIEQLTATGFGWNTASPRVLEKNGFVKEGVRKGVVKKWGKTTDLWIYGLQLR